MARRPLAAARSRTMQTSAAPVQPEASPSSSATVARHSLVVTGVGLAGKPLALIRDILITRAFGASAATDALFLALMLPMAIARVVGGGGLRVAFQPELARRAHQSVDDASRFGVAVLMAVAAITAVITLVLMVGAVPLAGLVASKERAEEVGALLRVLAPMLVLFSLQDILSGILHVRLRFFWPAMEAVLRNVAIIVLVLAFASIGIYAVAYGHLLGTLALVVACALSAKAAGLRLLLPRRAELRSLWSLLLASVPAALGGAIFPLCLVIDRMMAARLPSGSVSALTYADSIWQIGLVIAGPMSVVALPVFSGMAARGESKALADSVVFSVRSAAFVTAPVAMLLAALSTPTVELLFMRGQFDAADVALTSQAVAFYCLGLPFVAAQGVSMRVMQARSLFNDTAKLAVVVLVAHVLQNLVLMHLFGLRGIALGYGLSAALVLVLVDRRLRLPAPGRWPFVVRLTVCSMACFFAARLGAAWAPGHETPFIDTALRLVVGGSVGGVAFAGAALVVWGRSGWEMMRRVLRRRSSAG